MIVRVIFILALAADAAQLPTQLSRPLPIVAGTPVRLAPAPRPISSASLPAPVVAATPESITDGIATFRVFRAPGERHQIVVRLSDGATLSDTVPRRQVVQDPPASTAVDHSFYPRFTYDGVTYGTQGYGFSAYDAHTGQRYWRTLGTFGAPPSEMPTIVGDVLLQPFTTDGAILEEQMYGIDVRTGHVLWTNLSNGPPLAIENGTIALDATWFPMQRDNYLPLTVTTIEIATGKRLSSYTYLPDPARNADGYMQARERDRPFAFVTGGYVYLDANDLWYRYLADRPPTAPVSLGDARVRATFERGTLLIETAHGLALGSSTADVLTLRPIAEGALRAPIASRADGRQYAYAGASLIEFDRAGTPQTVGPAPCSSPDDAAIVFWSKRVAVLCGGAADRRAYVFADLPLAPPPKHVRPLRAPTPAWMVRIVSHDLPVPPGESNLRLQWDAGPIAARPGGDVAIGLTRNGNVGANAIAFVGADGVENLTTLMGGLEPVQPRTIVVDAAGATWFNDTYRDTITRLDQTGMHVVVGVPPAPVATPPGGRMMSPPRAPTGGYRIALGPDGVVWYARSNPNEIGRVDGTQRYAVPSAYGEVLALRGGGDALWFRTRTTIGRMTTSGAFSTIPFPLPGPFVYGLPPMSMGAGAGGTMWIGTGPHIFALGPRGVVRSAQLGDATAEALAIVSACDGSAYVAERTEQFAVIRPSGTVEEYPTEGLAIDGFARAKNCTIWFAGHDPFGKASVGTLSLERNR